MAMIARAGWRVLDGDDGEGWMTRAAWRGWRGLHGEDGEGWMARMARAGWRRQGLFVTDPYLLGGWGGGGGSLLGMSFVPLLCFRL